MEYEISVETRQAQRQRSEAHEERIERKAAWRRQENVRIALAECGGFLLRGAGALHVNRRWPRERSAREECEGFLPFEDPEWEEANRAACCAWVGRTWVPAARLLRRNQLAGLAISFLPRSTYQRETRRLFKRLLEAERVQDAAQAVWPDLAAVRRQLGEGRHSLGAYFESLWAHLKGCQGEGKAAERFRLALVSVEWVGAVNPSLTAGLAADGPWASDQLQAIWGYVREMGTCPSYPELRDLPCFKTWVNYVRKARSGLPT